VCVHGGRTERNEERAPSFGLLQSQAHQRFLLDMNLQGSRVQSLVPLGLGVAVGCMTRDPGPSEGGCVLGARVGHNAISSVGLPGCTGSNYIPLRSMFAHARVLSCPALQLSVRHRKW
jgi:hypothetical protein